MNDKMKNIFVENFKTNLFAMWLGFSLVISGATITSINFWIIVVPVILLVQNLNEVCSKFICKNLFAIYLGSSLSVSLNINFMNGYFYLIVIPTIIFVQIFNDIKEEKYIN